MKHLKNSFFPFLCILLCSALFSCEKNNAESCENFSANIEQDPVNSSSINLTATPMEGVPEYGYLWSTGENSASIDVTENANYSVTVTDGNQCTTTVDIDIEGLIVSCDSLIVDITDSYELDIWTLESSISNGEAPYSYSWSTGDNTSSIDVSEPGLYTVTVTDVNGCIGEKSHYITSPCSGFSMYIFGAIDSISTDSIFKLYGIVSGGTAPYSYTWSTGENTDNIIPSGGINIIYELEVIDSEGCVRTATYTFCQQITGSIGVVYDNNAMELNLSATAYGATAPYSYLWSNGETSSSIVATPNTEYSVEISDYNGCLVEKFYVPCENYDVQIGSQQDSVNMNATILTANVWGGVSPLEYAWSNGETTPSISVITTGVFTVTVEDAAGCIEEDMIEL